MTKIICASLLFGLFTATNLMSKDYCCIRIEKRNQSNTCLNQRFFNDRAAAKGCKTKLGNINVFFNRGRCLADKSKNTCRSKKRR